MSKTLAIVGIVVILIFSGYLGLAFVLRNLDKSLSSNSSWTQQQKGNAQKAVQGTVDQNLVGNWDTGCLVPDPNSPWAERHIFTINTNGTGNHKRSSGQTCDVLADDLDDNFNFVIPSLGQINLSYTSGIISGTTVYDIYQVSGNTLKFGHGFCNCASSGGKYGANESDRFVILNNFLAYKKQ